jgi:predicted SAM-dependent methyltransferase
VSWKHDAPQGNEVAKTRWRAMPYMRGKVLDLGCGPNKLIDSKDCIGVDSRKDTDLFNIAMAPDVTCDVKELTLFASASVDSVFSSHVLEHIPYVEVPSVLREWLRVVKVGGYLFLYLPDEDQYPKCEEPERGIYVSEPYANPDHSWNCNYDRVVAAAEKTGYNWDLILFEKCAADDEYSLAFCFKKLK